MPTRFRDDQPLDWSFFDEILVRCPRCGEAALVRRVAKGGARVTCVACGFADATASRRHPRRGPVEITARGRCPHCGRDVVRRQRAAAPPPEKGIDITCTHCSTAIPRARASWRQATTRAPVDPHFGLPLWLQRPFGDEVLWAVNGRHLAFLRDYITATLREREPYRNQSVASRLPAWMGRSTKRGALLAAIERLSALLTKGNGN